MYYDYWDEDSFERVHGSYSDYQLSLLSGRERPKMLVLQGDGTNFLSAVWNGVQEGTSNARTIHMRFKDDKEICISSTVLSNMSEYFEVMLGCGMKETLEGKVTLPTVTHMTFNRLLAFTLGQRVEIEGREELVELLQAAEMMQMQRVLAMGAQLLQQHLSERNCLETLSMVQRFQPAEVTRLALFIISNIRQISNTDEWCRLKMEDIYSIIEKWKENCDELVLKREVLGVISAVFRWMDAQKVTSAHTTQLLQLIPFERLPSDIIQEELAAHPSLMRSQTLMEAVQKLVKPKGEITLLVIGIARNRESSIYCWSERLQEWSHFPSPPEVLPQDFAVAKHKSSLVICGGINEDGSPSKKIWIVDKLGWRDGGDLNKARSKHAMTIFTSVVYIVGGLPGPLQSVERFAIPSVDVMRGEAGTLQEAVYDCSVTDVGLLLIVVGGSSSQGPKNIIQTFNVCTRAAEMITVHAPLDQGLDMGFSRFIGTMGPLLFLSRSGHLLKVAVEDNTCALQDQVLLKDFHHQSPFAALLDDGEVVVCDSSTGERRYSLDGEKKDKSTLIGRFKDDVNVYDVFRFFLCSEKRHTADSSWTEHGFDAMYLSLS